MSSLPAPIIAGNWKLNLGPSAASTFFSDFLDRSPRIRAGTVIVFPPALSLAAAREAVRDRQDVRLGVQNVYWEASGAFTGEISASMAADAGASLVLVGHSERRHVFGETDADTGRKVRSVLDAGLQPVFCVGETLDMRDAGKQAEVVERQLTAVVELLSSPDLEALVLAYEPVWAIGTGRTASPEDASAMHARIRAFMTDRHGQAGAGTPILYGGSVKPDNAQSLLEAPDVDGLLIGGASIDPDSFASICALLA